MLCARRPSIAGVEAQIAHQQPRENVVRINGEVHDPATLDVPADVVLDLTGVTHLGRRACAGLVGVLRSGPVRVRLVAGSQPHDRLAAVFGGALVPDLAHEQGWIIHLS